MEGNTLWENFGSIGFCVYFVCCILSFITAVDTIQEWKNKIIQPPNLSSSWVLLLIPFLIFILVLFSIDKLAELQNMHSIGIPFIIFGIWTVILQNQQVKDLKKIYQYQQTKEYVIKNIKTKSDEFKKSYHFEGPDIFGKTSIGKIRFHCSARGSQKEKGFLSLTGKFDHKYNFSQEAYDNHGNKIYLATYIDETVTSYQESYSDPDQTIRNKNGEIIGKIEGQTHYETKYRTTYSEIFTVYASLKQAKETEENYQIKLYGDKEVIIDIPREYILAFVEGIENKPEFNKIEWHQ